VPQHAAWLQMKMTLNVPPLEGHPEDVFSPFPPSFPYFIKGKYHYFSDAQQRFLQHILYFIM
jgi:hypothetical protein